LAALLESGRLPDAVVVGDVIVDGAGRSRGGGDAVLEALREQDGGNGRNREDRGDLRGRRR